MSAALADALVGAVLGGLPGVGIARWLEHRSYRYEDEQDLPGRHTRWVAVGATLAAAAVAAGQFPHDRLLGVLLVAFVPYGLALAAIDIDTHRLPDRLTLPGIVVAIGGVLLVAAVAGRSEPAVRSVLAGLALGAFYLANVVLGGVIGAGSGMGLGDAKYAVVLGVLLGALSWAHVVVATVLAFVTAGVHGLVMVVGRGAGRRSTLAFGPHMTLGALVVLAVPGLRTLVGG